MKVKKENEKVGLKLNIQKTKMMASGPITSWEVGGETVADFIFGGSKVTADDNFRHEIKVMFFPVVMHGCESWTIQKAEHRSIDAFELWY